MVGIVVVGDTVVVDSLEMVEVGTVVAAEVVFRIAVGTKAVDSHVGCVARVQVVVTEVPDVDMERDLVGDLG